MKNVIIIFCLSLMALAGCYRAHGQEQVTSVNHNALLSRGGRHSRGAARIASTSLQLPFFEDFTGYGPYPDSTKWMDDEVYINNTMCVSPVSRGVATFDCLNQYGIPYDTLSTDTYGDCDSLTSQPIDMSTFTPADSVYLSFFYQPQGNGYYPVSGDSLYLFLKNRYGDFVLVDSFPEVIDSVTAFQVMPFRQIMIPITDTLYFHSTFQFRFVNVGALNYADADWNIDYIRLDTGRNINDTLVNDIAWSSNPTFLLNDYTSMPYRQFMANPISETAAQFVDSANNDNTIPYLTGYGYSAVALNTGTVLQSPILQGPNLLSGSSVQALGAPAYTTTIPMSSVGMYDQVIFENTFFLQANAGTGNTTNDTIVRDQVFDNYLAYDDGTAEKSYYLNLSPTLDARIAIEFHLNQPDTMRGLAIYFGRTAPLQNYKNFGILVYSALQGVLGSTTEDTSYQQDYYTPNYVDQVNGFWVYTFATPVPLPAGTFYAGTIQYAESGDDSLYIGLDVNRIGPNHVYYNVLNVWQPSGVSGALMMRPVLGQQVWGTGVTNVRLPENKWTAAPNPAADALTFSYEGGAGHANYTLNDITGQTVMRGSITNGGSIDISRLQPGMYLASLVINGIQTVPQKIIKL